VPNQRLDELAVAHHLDVFARAFPEPRDLARDIAPGQRRALPAQRPGQGGRDQVLAPLVRRASDGVVGGLVPRAKCAPARAPLRRSPTVLSGRVRPSQGPMQPASRAEPAWIPHEQPGWPRQESNLRTRIRRLLAEVPICREKLTDMRAARRYARHSRVSRAKRRRALRAAMGRLTHAGASARSSSSFHPRRPELLQERRGRDMGLVVDPVDDERPPRRRSTSSSLRLAQVNG
jgi:hypothetical protein